MLNHGPAFKTGALPASRLPVDLRPAQTFQYTCKDQNGGHPAPEFSAPKSK